jgi:hypothetical protein
MNRLFASRRAALAAFALIAFGAAPLTASAFDEECRGYVRGVAAAGLEIHCEVMTGVWQDLIFAKYPKFAMGVTGHYTLIKDIKPDQPVRVTYRKLYGELHAELIHTIAKRR